MGVQQKYGLSAGALTCTHTLPKLKAWHGGEVGWFTEACAGPEGAGLFLHSPQATCWCLPSWQTEPTACVGARAPQPTCPASLRCAAHLCKRVFHGRRLRGVAACGGQRRRGVQRQLGPGVSQ